MEQKGTVNETPTTYFPDGNSIASCVDRTPTDLLLAMILAMKISRQKLSGEASKTACYLGNRLVS